MRGQGRRFACCLAGLGLIALCSSGCASGRKSLQHAAASHLAATGTSYNLAIEQAQDEMLLLNVIRAKDHRPMYVTDASKVTGTVKLDLSLGLTVPLHGGTAMNDYQAAPTIDYSSSPAMDVNLLNTKDFMGGFLAPIPQEMFAYYWDQGWPSEFLLYLLVLRVDVYERQADQDHDICDPEYEKNKLRRSEYAQVWSLERTVNNHPDIFEPQLSEMQKFAELVYDQVSKGRPRMESKDARNAEVGPALAPQKFDELVSVANEDSLSLDEVPKNSGKYQLKQQKKVYTLVPVSAKPSGDVAKNESRENKAKCEEKETAGDKRSKDCFSWNGLTEKTPNQIVMGSRCDRLAYALKLRSPEGVLYYLGQLARIEAGLEEKDHKVPPRALMIHVCDFDQKCDPKGNEPPVEPLFVALSKRNHHCPDGILEVRSIDDDYFIPGDEQPKGGGELLPQSLGRLVYADADKLCLPGRSMMALDLAAQLIGLQKAAKDVSTTSTVKLVGQ